VASGRRHTAARGRSTGSCTARSIVAGRGSRARLHVQLRAAGRFDLVINETLHGDQHIRILRDVFFHVRAGGALVVRDYRSAPDSRRRQDTGETLLSHLAAVLDDRHTVSTGAQPHDGTWYLRRDRSAASSSVIAISRSRMT